MATAALEPAVGAKRRRAWRRGDPLGSTPKSVLDEGRTSPRLSPSAESKPGDDRHEGAASDDENWNPRRRRLVGWEWQRSRTDGRWLGARAPRGTVVRIGCRLRGRCLARRRLVGLWNSDRMALPASHQLGVADQCVLPKQIANDQRVPPVVDPEYVPTHPRWIVALDVFHLGQELPSSEDFEVRLGRHPAKPNEDPVGYVSHRLLWGWAAAKHDGRGRSEQHQNYDNRSPSAAS